MILAWALTEVPRYAYYALSLAGCGVPTWLTWIRYSTFYVLYPIGAGSEALVMLSTIPEWRGDKWAAWGPEDWVKAGLVAGWVPGKLCKPLYIYSLTPRFCRAVDDVLTYDAYAPQSAWRRQGPEVGSEAQGESQGGVRAS